MSFVDARDAARGDAARVRARPRGRALPDLRAQNLTIEAFFARLERISGVPAPRLRTPRSMSLARAGATLLERRLAARAHRRLGRPHQRRDGAGLLVRRRRARRSASSAGPRATRPRRSPRRSRTSTAAASSGLRLERARGVEAGHVPRHEVALVVAVVVERGDEEAGVRLPADLVLERVPERQRLVRAPVARRAPRRSRSSGRSRGSRTSTARRLASPARGRR